VFRELLTLDQAERLLQKKIKPKPLGVELVKLLSASGRVLAENVVAKINIPAFDRSTVDGYAVRAEDTFGAEENKPVELKVRGMASIGELPHVEVSEKHAVEIVTGAPIPDGANAVVMVENTERDADHVRVFNGVSKNANILKAGGDIRTGAKALESHRVLGSREIGVVAALGLGEVKVFKVPRVAVLSTGPEVTEPGRTLLPGKIFDINAYSLSTAVIESGGEPVYLGVFPDEFEELQNALKKGFSCADLVVTSGGVSVGPKDIMPQALASLGRPGLILSGIAIKPGKPTTAGIINEKPAFLLPGHPTSALLVFQLLVRPIIGLMAGRQPKMDLILKSFTTARMFAAKGRRTFVMVTLRRDKSGKVLAKPVSAGESGAITTLAKATGFVVIPENVQFIDSDQEVTVHLLGKSIFD
jgi:putative molybdopterin biosynthesis protein